MKQLFATDQPEKFQHFRIGFGKRLFDIVFSLFVLTLSFPIFLLLALAIKLDSKGPVIYKSRRVGTGYDTFDFLKFRSMYTGSDTQLSKLSDLNLYLINKSKNIYADEADKCPQCAALGRHCSPLLFIDGNAICENWYFELKSRAKKNVTFFKMKDDPRITRVGRFMRRFNLDELPQFINVLKGDMSVVGNRPLPLYEAEKLTTDQFAYRFLAPAGITGLWQIQKNRFQSEEERIALDNQYALIASPLKDLQIILKTIPALFRPTNF
ncbi:MAG TPA: sugar transferase [Bacteroidales bacterium]|nr:sugar transferase [Bacteroidales bacterium]